MNSLDPWRVIATDVFGDVVWPRPFYGQPFYQTVPSWIHYGAPDDDTRYLFDGAFVGADHPGADMSNGITFKKELDAQQVLHVEICVDGKCYRTSMDLGPAIAMVMGKLAQSHAALHRAAGVPLPSDASVVSAVDRAVGVAGDALIGALVDQHTRTLPDAYAGSFFGDIGHALGGAANAVGGALKQLKAPASIAAGAAATYFGGPAAGPMAAQLTGALIDAAPGGSGDPAQQAAAQQTVAAASQAAKTNPTVQTALNAAQHATTQTTMAALGHAPAAPATQNSLASTVQQLLPLATQAMSGGGGGSSSLPSSLQSALSMFGSSLGGGGATAAVSGETTQQTVQRFAQLIRSARAGNQQARQELHNLRAAAQGGDQTARKILHEAQRLAREQGGIAPGSRRGFTGILSSTGMGAWHDIVGGCATGCPSVGAGPWYDIVGAVIDTVRAHAQSLAGAHNANVVGVIRTARGTWKSHGFRDADIADDWLGAATVEPSSYTYAAIYDKSDVLWPHPLNEKVGTARGTSGPEVTIPREVATTSGAWLW